MEFEKTTFIMAERLKALRESRGLSHQRLSQALREKYDINISKDALIAYESPEHHSRAGANNGMRAQYLRCLADFHGVSADYLLGLTDHPTSDMDERGASEYTGLSVENIRAFRELPSKDMAALNAFISSLPVCVLTSDLSNLRSAERADAFLAACYNCISGSSEVQDTAESELYQLQLNSRVFDSAWKKLLSNETVGLSLKEQEMCSFSCRDVDPIPDITSILAMGDVQIVLHDYFKHQIQDTLSDMLKRFIEDSRSSVRTKEILSLIEATVSECSETLIKEAAHGET